MTDLKTKLIKPIVKKYVKEYVEKHEEILKNGPVSNSNNSNNTQQTILINPKFFQSIQAYQKFIEHAKIVKEELYKENKNNLKTNQTIKDNQNKNNLESKDDSEKIETEHKEKTDDKIKGLNNSEEKISTEKFDNLTEKQTKELEENTKENLEEKNTNKQESQEEKPKSSIIEQFKMYREYKNILHKAKDVFPNSFSYNSFKNQVDHAYENGNLDYVSYALTTFETLNSFKNSPIYAQKLDELSKDSFFSTFAEILPQLSLENSTATPAFSGTENFNTKINEELSSSSQNEQNIIKTDSNEKPQVEIKKPDTSNKIIRDSRDAETMALGLISPSDISKITTRNAVNNINESYEQISSNKDASEEEIASYNQTITNFENVETDIEATYSASGEIINQNTHQNLDIPSTELSDEIQSSILESENETAQAQEEAVQEMIRRISE